MSMTQIATVYAQGLYSLAREEGLETTVLEQLKVLKTLFQENPDYTKLLAAPSLPKQERCGIIDESFRGRVHPYVLNFLKILTEKGYVRQFPQCCDAYRSQYNEDNGILVVKALSAVPLTGEQQQKLTAKLEATTGKRIELLCSVDPAQLGGLCLRYEDKQVDGTVRNRLESIGKLLKNTVL